LVESITDDKKAEVTFYPQPASNYPEIKSRNLKNSDNVKITIYDMIGKKVFSHEHCVQQNHVTVNLENSWPDGLNIVKVTGGNVSATGRFIKQKD
jgi:hypothetical protein